MAKPQPRSAGIRNSTLHKCSLRYSSTADKTFLKGKKLTQLIRILIGIFVTALLIPAGLVGAETMPEQRGLLITPPRQYLNVDPGKVTESSFTVANLTDKPLDIFLSVEQFSVANYTYDFKFEAPKEDWVKLEETKLTLQKTQSHTVNYTIHPPADAKPGGHYFTLFASVDLGEDKHIRAATVVYATSSGDLTKTSSIVKTNLPWLTIGNEVPISFDVQNTGNTHFLAYVSGVFRGWGPTQSSGETAHLLIPNTTRRVEGKLPGPIIPGLYKAVYGYRDEDGKDTRRSQYILYLPPWTWVFIAGIIWFVVVFVRRRRRLATGS